MVTLQCSRTELDASPDTQQGGGHVVEREGDVDPVVGCGSTHPQEAETHHCLQVADPRGLRQPWGRRAAQRAPFH